MIRFKQIKLLLLLSLTPLAASADNSVGTPVAAIDVNRNGAATYNLSIEIPDGGGFQPQIGLAYNSQSAGYGNAGYGFNITGISVITSGSRNLYYDGKVKGAEYLANSSYYLDGKRLVLESGTEGCDGAKYSVEGDPYTIVSVHGSYPDIWFEVLGQDGTTYKYGSSAGSRLSFKKQNTPCCAAWYIDQAIDKYKNLISYGYTKDNLCILPKSITYGVNLDKPRNMSCTIIFTYTNILGSLRRDFNIGGNKGTISQKLETITSYINSIDNVYRKYTLTYERDGVDSFSRLTKITESNGKGETYAPVVIDWNFLPSFATYYNNPIKVETESEESNLVEDEKMFIAADMNNDGVSDIIRLAPGRYEYYNRYYGLTDEYWNFLYISLSKVDLNGNVTYQKPQKMKLLPFIKSLKSVHDGFEFYSGGLSAMDFNGDGCADLMIPYYKHEGKKYYPSYSIIYGGSSPSLSTEIEKNFISRTYDCNPICTMMDMSGNGKTELISLETSKQNGYYIANILIYGSPNWKYESVKLSLDNKPKRIFTGDYNNDGLSDLIVLYDNGYKIFYNNGYTSSYASVFNNTNVYTVDLTGIKGLFAKYYFIHLRNCHEISQGDFNGDGLIDFVCSETDDGKLYLALNNGDGTFTYKITQDFGLYDQGDTKKDNNDLSINVIDLDHDGKSDIVIAKSMFTPERTKILGITVNTDWHYENGKGTTYIEWLRSKGDGDFERCGRFSKKNREKDASPEHIFIGDFDGDGAPELANYGTQLNRSHSFFNYNEIYIYKCGENIPSLGKVSAITDALGVKTSFKYSSAVNPAVGEIGVFHNDKVNSYAIPLSVVSEMSTSAQGVSTDTIKFQYSDMRVHSLGRGALGFRSFTKKNVNTGVTENTTIKDWLPNYLAPQVIESTITMPDGSKNRTVQEYNCTKFATSFDSTDKFYKYFAYPSTSTVTDYDLNVTTTTWTYDTSKGVVTKQNVSNDGGKLYKETEYTYPSDKICNMWLPTQIKSTQKHYDDSKAYSVVKQYTYDKVYGNPSTIVTIPNSNSALALTTTYTYDSYGNKLSEITTSDKDDNVKKIQTLYEYNSMGNRFVTGKKTSPASTSIVYEYDMFGDLVKEKDNTVSTNILETSHTPNGWNEITKTTYPDGNYVEYSKVWEPSYGTGYYSITETPNNGPWTKTVYDPFGREISTTSVGLKGVAISKETTYNSKGQVSSVVNKTGNLTLSETYTYDDRGRKIKEESSTGASTTFSYGDRTVTTTSAGRTKTAKCDAWGNMLETTDPLGTTVTYTYNSNGQPSCVTTDGSEVTFKYDDAGRCIEMNDPDAGTMTYSYAADGTILSQTDAKEVVTKYFYDDLGRITKTRIGSDLITYEYKDGGYGHLQLEKQSMNGFETNYTYDQYGRVTTEERITDKATLKNTYTYNPKGQLSEKTYTGGLTVSYSYDEYGYNTQIAANDQIVYKAEQFDGYTISSSFLDKLISSTKTTFYPGEVNTSRQIGKGSLNLLVNFHNEWHDTSTGNMLSRQKGFDTSEEFRYDSCDRLTNVTRSDGTGLEMTYDEGGVMTYKSDMGNYNYDDTEHIHAVSSVTECVSSKIYDNSRVSTDFNDFGKISSIYDDHSNMRYYYGPDLQRWRSYYSDASGKSWEALYFGDYERITDNGKIREFYYICDNVIIVREDLGAFKPYLVFKDGLGSILTVRDENATRVFDATYDVWGKQTININDIGLMRGYTGHEHVYGYEFINMNGRIYDPILAQFLSPDNYVQDPTNSQNFNRYSYCLNNPLKYTDPSGNIYGIDDFVIVSAIFAAGSSALMASATDQNVWAAVGKSLVTSAVCYGASYLASCATTAIGTSLGHEIGSLGTELTRGAAHGIVQGMSSVVTGGSFESGFATGFVSSLVGSGSRALGYGANTTLGSMTIAGGLTSLLTGGDFNSGAMTGYSIGALNHMAPGGPNGKTKDGGTLQEVCAWGNRKFSQLKTWCFQVETAYKMTRDWARGIGPDIRYFAPGSCISDAMRDAWRVNEAREFFYEKYKGKSLINASVTDYQGKFGLEGLVRAGLDPIEQFIGSYDIDIYAINKGTSLLFVLSNRTSVKSLLAGFGPAYSRDFFAPGGNMDQKYMFIEPVRKNR